MIFGQNTLWNSIIPDYIAERYGVNVDGGVVFKMDWGLRVSALQLFDQLPLAV